MADRCSASRNFRRAMAAPPWRFISAEHKMLFEAEPQRYLPAYGGFCAYGTSRGYLVKIEPEAWSIVDGRLYLNYDLGVRKTWLAKTQAYIAQADANWPSLARKPR
ncbi:YHS domain-containing (seleno)protein [Bosea vestrisii]|uniref:YHS domain-containing (seleno)protein n=1 Tax=Bosea vestrisii TaxID=151416 RepID=UPI0024DF978E|nr:YHS domain-containing (seleno)protein [Bosea vestrisii]WID99527.1 YHS domain-containing (seleno)protein [Bosea vestrisii]